MQLQMRTPPEEREQENNNKQYKKILQEIVSVGLVLNFDGLEQTYEQIIEKCINHKPIEKKVVPQEIQAKILAGQELTPEEMELLRK